MSADAVTYHASLAGDWEHRYQKRSFRSREAVLLKCLQGRNLAHTFWLDAGCGTGTLSRCLASRGCQVVGVDAASQMVRVATELVGAHRCSHRLKFTTIDTIARLPLDNGSTDGVLCSSVLEYVANPSACLTEFARVLRVGGLLLVSVPNRDSAARRIQLACHHMGSLIGATWARFLDYSHQQYSSREFEKVLTQANFSVEKILPFGGPLPSLAQRSRRWASLLMFVAHKTA